LKFDVDVTPGVWCWPRNAANAVYWYQISNFKSHGVPTC